MGHPALEWPAFYNAFVERFMPESLRDSKAREFEHLKKTAGMSVLEYDTKFNQLARYAAHMVMTIKYDTSQDLSTFTNYE